MTAWLFCVFQGAAVPIVMQHCFCLPVSGSSEPEGGYPKAVTASEVGWVSIREKGGVSDILREGAWRAWSVLKSLYCRFCTEGWAGWRKSVQREGICTKWLSWEGGPVLRGVGLEGGILLAWWAEREVLYWGVPAVSVLGGFVIWTWGDLYWQEGIIFGWTLNAKWWPVSYILLIAALCAIYTHMPSTLWFTYSWLIPLVHYILQTPELCTLSIFDPCTACVMHSWPLNSVLSATDPYTPCDNHCRSSYSVWYLFLTPILCYMCSLHLYSLQYNLLNPALCDTHSWLA